MIKIPLQTQNKTKNTLKVRNSYNLQQPFTIVLLYNCSEKKSIKSQENTCAFIFKRFLLEVFSDWLFLKNNSTQRLLVTGTHFLANKHLLVQSQK